MTRTLLRVAWMSVLLGLAMEICVLGAAQLFGGKWPSAAGLVADSAQKVSWSFLVCVGLALGSLSANAPVPATSFAGLIAAPLAFATARALHKGVSQALSLTTSSNPPPILPTAIIKGIEYGCLGLVLAQIGKRRQPSALVHIGVGLVIGAVFGVATLSRMPPAPMPAQAARATNEILFPVGCSLVLYAARVLRPRFTEPG